MNKHKTLNVYMQPEELKMLDEILKPPFDSKSQLIRHLIRQEYLRQEKESASWTSQKD